MGKEKSIGMRLLQTAPFRGNGSSIVMTCRYPLVGRCFYGIKYGWLNLFPKGRVI